MNNNLSGIIIIYIFIILLSIGPQSAQAAQEASDSVNIILEVTAEEEVPLPSAGGSILIVDSKPPTITNVDVSEITPNSAVISWLTNEPAVSRLFYGKTTEYELGKFEDVSYLTRHLAELSGLTADTVYYFKIICLDSYQNSTTTDILQFKTRPLPDRIPPLNVSNLTAKSLEDRIELTWDNPWDKDFFGVMIRRSDQFYPQDPHDGQLVYKNRGEEFIDREVITGVEYYYTVFAYDYAGNYSSGAIVKARLWWPGEVYTEEIPVVEEVPVVEEISPATPVVAKLRLDDFIFSVKGTPIKVRDGHKLDLKTQDPLNITLPFEKFPGLLKTIVITLKHGNKAFSFLLRANFDKTVYEATVQMPAVPDLYPFIVNILNYKDKLHQQLFGEIVVGGLKETSKPSFALIIKKTQLNWARLLGSLLGILLTYLFYRLVKRRVARVEEYYH